MLRFKRHLATALPAASMSLVAVGSVAVSQIGNPVIDIGIYIELSLACVESVDGDGAPGCGDRVCLPGAVWVEGKVEDALGGPQHNYNC